MSGSLLAERTDLGAVADEFGTPLYVYDLDEIARRAAALQRAMPDGVDVCYAVKANPSLAVLARLARCGLGADVASLGEFEAVMRAGFEPARIIFTGPGKRDAELRRAVEAGVRAVTVESLGELARLEALAAESGRRAGVLLRMASPAAVSSKEGVIDLGSAKFGMEPVDLEAAARRTAASDSLELLGLHAFGASNMLDAQRLAEHAADTLAAADRLSARLGVSLPLVDVGGGLGIPYADGEAELDVEALGRALGETLGRSSSRRLVLEPGRYLVGPAGIYLTRVLEVKPARDPTVIIVDGGVHHLLRPALIGRSHRIRPIGPMSARAPTRLTVGGPLCTGIDVLAHDVELPAPARGDLLGVLDAGAYGFSESMPFFLSHPTAAEVAISNGCASLIRPPLMPDAVLDSQLLT